MAFLSGHGVPEKPLLFGERRSNKAQSAAIFALKSKIVANK